MEYSKSCRPFICNQCVFCVWSNASMSSHMTFELKDGEDLTQTWNKNYGVFLCVYISGVNGVISNLRIFMKFLYKPLFCCILNASTSSVNLIFFSPHLYLNKYMGNVGVFVFPFTHCVSELVVLFANSKRSWLKRYFLGYLLYTQCRIPVCNLHAVEVVKCLVRTLFAQVSL